MLLEATIMNIVALKDLVGAGFRLELAESEYLDQIYLYRTPNINKAFSYLLFCFTCITFLLGVETSLAPVCKWASWVFEQVKVQVPQQYSNEAGTGISVQHFATVSYLRSVSNTRMWGSNSGKNCIRNYFLHFGHPSSELLGSPVVGLSIFTAKGSGTKIPDSMAWPNLKKANKVILQKHCENDWQPCVILLYTLYLASLWWLS